MTTPLLQVQGLSFEYPERSLFKHWSHDFSPGLTWLRDANADGYGSGKTSLLRLLATELTPAAGRLLALGVDASLDPLGYRRQLVWCGADLHSVAHLTPDGYISRLAGQHPAMDLAALPALLQSLEVDALGHKTIDQLSTGTRRKLAVAVALVSRAPVLLLDEPLAGVDQRSAKLICSRLAALARDGQHLLVVASHADLGEASDIAVRLDLPTGSGTTAY